MKSSVEMVAIPLLGLFRIRRVLRGVTVNLLAVVNIVRILACLVLIDQILDNLPRLVKFLQSILEQRSLSVGLQKRVSFPKFVKLVACTLEQLLWIDHEKKKR